VWSELRGEQAGRTDRLSKGEEKTVAKNGERENGESFSNPFLPTRVIDNHFLDGVMFFLSGQAKRQ
jgi:hypothetical protein